MAFKNKNCDIVCAPAGERIQMIIEKNEQPIVRLMDPERISRLLLDKGVINFNDLNQILLPSPIHERNRALIAKLLTCGLSGYQNFMASLQESDTSDHNELFRILSNDDPILPGLSVDERLRDGSQKRINEKMADHEHRIKTLEDELRDARSDDDMESIWEDLKQRTSELDEIRKTLKTREGELQEAREENRQLHKRIQCLEKRIQSLETALKDQRLKFNTVTKQQQQDKKRIEALEDKLDSAEKKMNKKLHDQEKHHEHQMDEIKQMIREQAKLSHSTDTKAGPQPKPSKVSHKNTGASAKNVATGNQQKETMVAKHRFQDDKPKHVPQARPPLVFKKSSPTPVSLPAAKTGDKRSK